MARRRGLTLIELILVLAVLGTMMAISAPSFSRFFGGRDLEEEARRFLTLTHYARSQAVSLSAPIELWIDLDTGQYGARVQASYATDTDREVEFQLTEGLSLEERLTDAEEDDERDELFSSEEELFLYFNELGGLEENVLIIGFRPDGEIAEGAPAGLVLMNRHGDILEIALDEDKLEYVIASDANASGN